MSRPNRARAKTRASRENQLVSLAVDLAEKQLAEGTASAQVITHYLKLGTTTHELELEKLRLENELKKAQTKQIASQEETEKMYREALKAMRRYAGGGDGESDEGSVIF